MNNINNTYNQTNFKIKKLIILIKYKIKKLK